MEPSSQEATKVIKYLIQSCPIGEQKEVLEDIQKLHNINYELFQDDLRQHNEDHLAILTDGTQRILVFGDAYQNGKYHDQTAGKAYTVDHQTNTITSSEPYQSSLSESARQFVVALTQKLRDYVNKYFKETHASQVFSDDDGNQVIIAFTAKNLNFGNFYGGQWISVWTLTSDNQLQGSVKINTHFFEAGNVQLHQCKKLGPIQIDSDGNAENRATGVIAGIQKLQGRLQASLSQLYEQIPDKFFRSLRKLIPFTKTKMDWNVATLSIKQNLQSMTKPSN